MRTRMICTCVRAFFRAAGGTGAVLAAVGAVFSCAAWADPPAKPAAPRTQVAERPKPRTLHQFTDKNGVMTFTNRPDKYKHRSGYKEVKITYERIPLPKAYKPAQPPMVPKVVTDETLLDIVKRYAQYYALPESLVKAVIHAESSFKPNAVSPAGARGLMQLMPGTALEMGVTDIFDPEQNVAGGTQYLRKMIDIFGDKRLALAAYNAGPENVKKHGGVPPFQETQSYVKIVLGFESAYAGGAPASSLRVASAKPFHRIQAAPSKGAYTVVFHSGLTQPADKVEDKEPYWYIEYANRVYPVRKDLVKSVEKG
ncbi:MAG TPA: lytic transglycosylase domain-containing protein [Candidatus Hydrogenedentes bacterium]|nr:lytic transglycosylase domain-containing protein [Candidatus Hydrogenedentota bacterium]